MPIYDSDLNRIVVRLVYDGPGFAGKTTNVRQLHGFFTEHRRGEIYTPEEVNGRTQFFDWMHLDGGLVQGTSLRCQLLTVPGQGALMQRRWALLEKADVIVFVFESTPEGIEIARPMFSSLRELVGSMVENPPPFVLQGNKQDLPGALPIEEAAARLDAPGVPCVGAAAASGTGVRETIVLAIREAANRVQTQILEHGISSIAGHAETADELLTHLKELEGSAVDGAMQVTLDVSSEGSDVEEVEAASLTHEGVRGMDAPPASSPPAAPTADRPSKHPSIRPAASSPTAARARAASVAYASEDRALSGSLSESPARAGASRPTDAYELKAGRPRLGGESRIPPHSTAKGYIPPSPKTIRPAADLDEPLSEPPEAFEDPPLPNSSVGSGLLWPSATGRAILHRLNQAGPPIRRGDLTGQHGLADGSGRNDSLIYEVGPFCAKTSLRRRFTDPEEARTELLQLARVKTSILDLLPNDSAVALMKDDQHHLWLWTIAPWVTTLRTQMVDAMVNADEGSLTDALEGYARCVLAALKTAASKEIVLDVHPSNFAIVDDRICYLDDDVDRGTRIPAIGHAMLKRVEEFARLPEAVERYLSMLEGLIERHLRADEITKTSVHSILESEPARSDLLRESRARLVRAIEKASRASATR